MTQMAQISKEKEKNDNHIFFFFFICVICVICGLILAFSGLAHADPPDVSSEDYAILAPHSEWLHAQTGPSGVSCCSIADCRTVEWHQAGADIEILLSSAKFPQAPDRWVSVPSAIIHRDQNPTGRAVACWSAARQQDGGFYCFWLPSLT